MSLLEGKRLNEESKTEDSKETNTARSGRFWALVAASFVFWKVLPTKKRAIGVPSQSVPRAANQIGSDRKFS